MQRDKTLLLSAARPEDTQALRDQCYEADTGATSLLRDFQDFETKPTFRDTVRSQATMEPDTGRCDVALVTLIPTDFYTYWLVTALFAVSADPVQIEKTTGSRIHQLTAAINSTG